MRNNTSLYLSIGIALFLISVALVLSVPFSTDAAVQVDPLVHCGTQKDASGTVINPCSTCDVFVIGQRVLNFIWWFIAAPLAVLMLLWSGFLMIIPIVGGEGGPMYERGKKAFFNTIIGILIIFFAWVAIDTVVKLLAGQIGSGRPAELNQYGPWNTINCQKLEDVLQIPAEARERRLFQFRFGRLPNEEELRKFSAETGGIPIEGGIYNPYPGDVGCDIKGKEGTSIRAIADGTLRYNECAVCKNGTPTSNFHSATWDCEGVNTGRGDCAVSVTSDKNNYISYLHMSDYNTTLQNGQKIKKGDLLGYVGVANNSPHVHIEFGDEKNPYKACDITRDYVGGMKVTKSEDEAAKKSLTPDKEGEDGDEAKNQETFRTASDLGLAGEDEIDGGSILNAVWDGIVDIFTVGSGGEGKPVTPSGKIIKAKIIKGDYPQSKIVDQVISRVYLDNTVIDSFNKAIKEIRETHPEFQIARIDSHVEGHPLAHGKGLAFDINPQSNPCTKNPWVKKSKGCNGGDSGGEFNPYKNAASVTREIVEIFSKYGWCWGGNWYSFKDYMHFSRDGNECKAKHKYPDKAWPLPRLIET